MIEIIDGLFLGNRDAARDLPRLRQVGVTHVVNCTDELPCFHSEELVYLQLWLRDPDPAFADRLEQVCTFIDEARREGKVLVHCFASISRGPATVLAYLCHTGLSVEEAARHLGGLVWTYPDYLFLEQLCRHRGLDPETTVAKLSSLLQGRADQ